MASDLIAPPVPAAFPRLLVSVAAQRGVRPERLLDAAGVRPEALERASGQAYASEYAALIEQALQLTGDSCLGCEMGLSMPPTMHGLLGYALLSAGTLGEALDLGVRYGPLTSRFVNIHAQRGPEGAVLTATEALPLGFAQRFAIECTLVGWVHTAEQLTHLDAQATDVELHFAWPEPADFAAYRHRLPRTVFNTPAHQIRVSAVDLQRPLVFAYPAAAAQARAHCDAELARLRHDAASLATAVADALTLSANGYPGMTQVAQRLRISTRTLTRRLDAFGLSFRQLLDERRRLDAQTLLDDPTLPIELIAQRLGYSEPANFTRAFKRWTGATPSEHRRQRHAAQL